MPHFDKIAKVLKNDVLQHLKGCLQRLLDYSQAVIFYNLLLYLNMQFCILKTARQSKAAQKLDVNKQVWLEEEAA